MESHHATSIPVNIDELLLKNKILEEQVQKLTTELMETKEHLKKYTAPPSSKIYYEKHKEEQIQRVKDYKKNTNYKPTTEQKKEYNKTAYLKRKESKNIVNQNV